MKEESVEGGSERGMAALEVNVGDVVAEETFSFRNISIIFTIISLIDLAIGTWGKRDGYSTAPLKKPYKLSQILKSI